MATVFDTVDECNCGVLATQASVGPTRVGCYFLIVIATAGAGGFYRSTGLLVGIVARSLDNRDRSLGAHSRAASATQSPVALIFDGGFKEVFAWGSAELRPFRASTFHHTTSKVERGEAQQPTTGRFRQSRRRICRAEIRRTEGVEASALCREKRNTQDNDYYIMHDLERATPHSAQGSSRCRRVEGPLAEFCLACPLQ